MFCKVSPTPLTFQLTGGCILYVMDTTDDKTAFKISELAKRLGLNVRTLRCYESIGFLRNPPRSEEGYRIYTASDEERLCFVLRAKRVGFSLVEIREIIRLSQHGKACD